MNTWKQQLAKTPKMPTPEHLQVKLRGEWNTVPTDRVLYVHYRADDGLPYYVGYGEPDRPVSLSGRNGDWHTVSEKHGRIVEVKLAGLHEHVANIIEVWWIYSYRQKFGRYSEGGTMVNRSSGGGCPATGSKRNAEQLANQKIVMNKPEVKAKMREVQKIAQNRPEVKLKKSEASKVAMNRPEVRVKQSEVQKIAQNRPEVKLKRSEASKVAMNRPEVRAKRSKAQTGKLGEQCNTFKGFCVGVNAERFVILAGRQEMRGNNFCHGHIYACILGNRSSHKGFTWTRQNTLNYQDFLHLKPFNELSRDRVIDAIPEEFHAHLMALDGKEFLAYALFN